VINARIADGFGTGISQRIFPNGAGLTTSNQIPPFGEVWPVVPFVSNLKNSAGSTDMRVSGSLAAPEDFFITASVTADRFITAISFLISDDNPVLNKFGNITALTNGCLLLYETPASVTQVLPALKTNFDFIRMSFGSPALGADATAFRAGTAVAVNSEAYLPVIRFVDWLPPFGLKLDIASGNRIILRVRDDTTTVDAFDAIVFGFDRVAEKHTKPTTLTHGL
jgi:hypothetical protein